MRVKITLNATTHSSSMSAIDWAHKYEINNAKTARAANIKYIVRIYMRDRKQQQPQRLGIRKREERNKSKQ